MDSVIVIKICILFLWCLLIYFGNTLKPHWHSLLDTGDCMKTSPEPFHMSLGCLQWKVPRTESINQRSWIGTFPGMIQFEKNTPSLYCQRGKRSVNKLKDFCKFILIILSFKSICMLSLQHKFTDSVSLTWKKYVYYLQYEIIVSVVSVTCPKILNTNIKENTFKFIYCKNVTT